MLQSKSGIPNNLSPKKTPLDLKAQTEFVWFLPFAQPIALLTDNIFYKWLFYSHRELKAAQIPKGLLPLWCVAGHVWTI